MRRFVQFTLCAWALVTGMATASAQGIPEGCQNTRDQRAFLVGQAAGASLARQAWRSIDDCDRVEHFEEIVLSALDRYAPPSSPTTYTLCRFVGVAAGIVDTLDEVFFECTDACLLEGELVGEMSALVYCELSIALNGLRTAEDFIRGPVQVCGLSFEIGCDSAFLGTAFSYDNSVGACLPFTEGEFEPVFDQARENQCAYNPLPEELVSIQEADKNNRE